MNSSMAFTLPLTHTSSHHQRTRALFFSSSHTGASSSLPTLLSLAGAMHHTHDATRRRDAAYRLEAHSPNLVEGCSRKSECRIVHGPRSDGPRSAVGRTAASLVA